MNGPPAESGGGNFSRQSSKVTLLTPSALQSVRRVCVCVAVFVCVCVAFSPTACHVHAHTQTHTHTAPADTQSDKYLQVQVGSAKSFEGMPVSARSHGSNRLSLKTGKSEAGGHGGGHASLASLQGRVDDSLATRSYFDPVTVVMNELRVRAEEKERRKILRQKRKDEIFASVS